MDGRILKSIIRSCKSATKDLEKTDDYQRLLREDKFLPKSDVTFNALCTSLTNLLNYKVSKQAYQRYAVRLAVIDVLRDCCRITDGFTGFRAFTDEKQTLNFVQCLLEKYLTDDIIDNCTTDDKLLPLASSLMCLVSKDSYYKEHIIKLLSRLSQLECCNESEQLLRYAVCKDSNLNLDLPMIEKIYYSQRCKLIDEPLLHNFMATSADLNKDNSLDNLENIHLIDQLFEYSSRSQCIFQLVCGFLKELLISLDYAPAVMDFIQSTLNDVIKRTEKQGKNILDLYPKYLQSSIILLQIEPSYHSIESKESVLRTLEYVLVENKHTAVILLSHFPMWLKVFGEHLAKDTDVFQ